MILVWEWTSNTFGLVRMWTHEFIQKNSKIVERLSFFSSRNRDEMRTDGSRCFRMVSINLDTKFDGYISFRVLSSSYKCTTILVNVETRGIFTCTCCMKRLSLRTLISTMTNTSEEQKDGWRHGCRGAYYRFCYHEIHNYRKVQLLGVLVVSDTGYTNLHALRYYPDKGIGSCYIF